MGCQGFNILLEKKASLNLVIHNLIEYGFQVALAKSETDIIVFGIVFLLIAI
jgi:hypothetical protein